MSLSVYQEKRARSLLSLIRARYLVALTRFG